VSRADHNAPLSDARPEVAWVNGHAAEQVSVLERGLQYGDGLFETIACVEGRPRLLERHLERLAMGCARLGIEGIEPTELGAEIRSLAAEAERAIIKLILTRGPALARGYAPTGRESPTRIALRYAWPVQETSGEAGVRVRIARLRLGENPALAGLKHLNRLEQVLARREWSDPHIAEALLFSGSGALISGTMTNVFIVIDSKLYTPRLDRCGVAGVMRRLVLEVAAAAGVPAEERSLDAHALESAQELFLTNALIGIRPVGELEGKRFAPGPVTARLSERVDARLKSAPPAPRGGAGA